MRSLPRVAYDGKLMAEDVAEKGWEPRDLARRAKGISLRTVYRFLSGEVQTAHTAKELARVIEQPISRYLIRSRRSRRSRRRAEAVGA